MQEAKYSGDTTGEYLEIRWETPGGLPFPMPIDVVVDGKKTRLPMADGKATILSWNAGRTIAVDPDAWVLKAQ